MKIALADELAQAVAQRWRRRKPTITANYLIVISANDDALPAKRPVALQNEGKRQCPADVLERLGIRHRNTARPPDLGALQHFEQARFFLGKYKIFRIAERARDQSGHLSRCNAVVVHAG